MLRAPNRAPSDCLNLSSRARRAGFFLISGLLVLIAFFAGWHTVAGLRWPWDADLFRNIANGVTFKDGDLLSDAHYSGLPAWYSPLTSALLALGALVTRLPVNRLGTQGGAVLNLVTPIALCWATARWFGRRVAVAALLAYLFVIGANYPSSVIASYSPWLFVTIYAAGAYILALAAVPAAVNRASTKDALLLGVASGFVVLAHPAAAVLLAAVVLVQFLVACWRASTPVLRRLARSAAITMSTALVVSTPYWLPIMIWYGGRIVNDAPGRFTWPALERDHVWEFVRDFAWRWPSLVIAIGVAIWVARRLSPRVGPTVGQQTLERTTRRFGPIAVGGISILMTWTIASFLLFVLETYRESTLVRVVRIPAAPSYHYLLLFSVALCIWFGLSLNAIVGNVLGNLDRRYGALAVTLVVTGIAVWTVPNWTQRSDLVDGRRWSQSMQARSNGFAVVNWIRAHTQTNDKFLNVGVGLANGKLLQGFVLFAGLADRKSVVVNIPEFSNPFVSFTERERDAEHMLGALRMCRFKRFDHIARRYGHVRFVLAQTGAGLVTACPDRVPTVYSDPMVSVQEIVGSEGLIP